MNRTLCGATALVALSLLAMSVPVRAESVDTAAVEVKLRLYNVHTGKRVDVPYRRGDRYLPEGLRALDDFLRDYRTGDEKDFDPALFDLLHDLASKVDKPDAEIQVISGYRSPKSNEFLRRTRQGVAQKSLHMQAQAIDIRIPGVQCATLQQAALSLKRGGVGFYPELDFVHVDTGRVRRW